MAVYNGEQYLEEQLDSIAAQTILPDELILRDDGSTDQSVQVIERWMEAHPGFPAHLIQAQQNAGYRINFSKAMEQAKGDWIFLSDQDDAWLPDKIETMQSCAESHPEIRLLASSFVFMDKNSEPFDVIHFKGWSNNNLIPWQVEHAQGLNEITFEQMLLHNYFQGCSMMIHRSIVQEFLNVSEIPIPHDWYLALLAAGKNALFYLDRPLFRYRIHDRNTIGLPILTGNRFARYWKDWNSERVRTIGIEQSCDVLETVEKSMPARWNPRYAAMLDFGRRYLGCITDRNPFAYLGLLGHPARKDMLHLKPYAVGLFFICGHLFSKSKPEGKDA